MVLIYCGDVTGYDNSWKEPKATKLPPTLPDRDWSKLSRLANWRIWRFLTRIRIILKYINQNRGLNMTLKEKHFIDIHKGVTGLFMLFLMNLYGMGKYPHGFIWVFMEPMVCYGYQRVFFFLILRGRRKLPFGMVCTFGLV